MRICHNPPNPSFRSTLSAIGSRFAALKVEATPERADPNGERFMAVSQRERDPRRLTGYNSAPKRFVRLGQYISKVVSDGISDFVVLLIDSNAT